MKSYTGELKELGPSQQSAENVKFIYIQIGDSNLTNVSMKPVLASYLQRGLETSDDVTIWIKKSWFNTVALGASVNGRVIFNSPQIYYFTIVFNLCIVLGFFSVLFQDGFQGFAVFGLPSLLAVILMFKRIKELDKIKRQEK